MHLRSMSSNKLGDPESPFSVGLGPIDLNSFLLTPGQQPAPGNEGALEVRVLHEVGGARGPGEPILCGFWSY